MIPNRIKFLVQNKGYWSFKFEVFNIPPVQSAVHMKGPWSLEIFSPIHGRSLIWSNLSANKKIIQYSHLTLKLIIQWKYIYIYIYRACLNVCINTMALGVIEILSKLMTRRNQWDNISQCFLISYTII